mgnify:CR=1 FL=1|jgi:uncharacterized membrane protein YfcA
MLEAIVLIFTGFFAGILGHLLGVGGGIIMMPMMVLLFKYPMHVAVPASLVAIVANSANVAANNIKKEIANIPLGLTLETVTVTFAIIGGFISFYINERALLIIFSITMLFVAFIYVIDIGNNQNININNSDKICVRDTYFYNCYFDERLNKKIYYNVYNIFLTMCISSIAGILSSLLGIGGGFVKVPAMNLISKVPIKAAVATSNFMIGITASAGALVYLLYSRVDPHLMATITIGIYFGSQFSIKYFSKIADRKIKIIFIILIITVSVEMFIEALNYG